MKDTMKDNRKRKLHPKVNSTIPTIFTSEVHRSVELSRSIKGCSPARLLSIDTACILWMNTAFRLHLNPTNTSKHTVSVLSNALEISLEEGNTIAGRVLALFRHGQSCTNVTINNNTRHNLPEAFCDDYNKRHGFA